MLRVSYLEGRMLAPIPTLAELPFRGDRNYLHSTDLFPALTKYAQEEFSPAAFIENLTIRRAVSHQVRVNLDTTAGAFGSFCIRDKTERHKGWLIETDKPVRARIPFDETAAVQAAICGPGFACLQTLLPAYSVFELLLLLTKMVAHQKNTCHWWLCQIDFFSPLLEVAPLECKLKRKISNRYLLMEIYQAEQLIGSASGMTDDRPARSNP